MGSGLLQHKYIKINKIEKCSQCSHQIGGVLFQSENFGMTTGITNCPIPPEMATTPTTSTTNRPRRGTTRRNSKRPIYGAIPGQGKRVAVNREKRAPEAATVLAKKGDKQKSKEETRRCYLSTN